MSLAQYTVRHRKGAVVMDCLSSLLLVICISQWDVTHEYLQVISVYKPFLYILSPED